MLMKELMEARRAADMVAFRKAERMGLTLRPTPVDGRGEPRRTWSKWHWLTRGEGTAQCGRPADVR